MIKCENCGTERTADVSICPTCGTAGGRYVDNTNQPTNQQPITEMSNERLRLNLSKYCENKSNIINEAIRRGLIQHVNVTDVDIPFGSVFKLVFKCFCASLIIALPLWLLIWLFLSAYHTRYY